MKKKLFAFLAIAVAASCMFTSCAKKNEPKKAKYVFYFISDGTGVNTVQGAEYYLGQSRGIQGRVPLCMTSLPVVGVSATWSASSDVTDSAASGTALACGEKTYNSAIGLLTDSVTETYSIAKRAYEAGYAVGIGTSVPLNHATPAAEYAHSVLRKHYFEIAKQIYATGFDFFGGSEIHIEHRQNTPENRQLLADMAKEAGYTVTYGLKQYEETGRNADKVIMLQDQDVPDVYSLPYWIDRKPGQVTIVDQLRAQIEFLYRKSEEKGGKGFFLMNEIGGKVDFACHANDAATAFEEVLAVDSCVKLAYEFYKAHPDETLIVLTADHETGGLTLGCQASGYSIRTNLLKGQKVSKDESTRHFQALRAANNNKVSWEQVRQMLTDDFGFWDTVQLTADEEKQLRDIYERSFKGHMSAEKNLYSENEQMSATAVRILAAKAAMGWTTGGHTAGLVPVYACGVGQELFMGHNDNAQIPLNIAKAMGLKW